MIRLGFAILAHERLDRAAALVGHLSGHGAPVAVHLDPRAGDPGPLVGIPGVTVLRTRQADWGRFGLVEATLDCVETLLQGPEIDHVCLISGSCLPLRGVAELAAMLSEQPDTDFIESVSVANDNWVQGGLSRERFTLFHPFSWRRQRRLFDLAVDVQRALRVRRKIPDELQPHLGLQWWCLSTRTLRALLEDGRLPAWRRFFRRTWIPDEGFFQTLVRALRPEQEPLPPLHLARFDPRGRPYVFHDDHAELLAGSGAWFARKIDPDADALYERFLADTQTPSAPSDIDTAFEAARDRENSEGTGLLSAARYPRRTTQISVATARPYLVVVADDPAAACEVLKGVSGLAVHVDLFGDEPPLFAGDELLHWGNLMADLRIRDHRPAQFLAMTVRADRALGRRSVFGFSPVHRMPARKPRFPGARLMIGGQVAGDPNARLVILGDPRTMLERVRSPYLGRNPRHPPPKRPLRAWWTGVEAPCAGSALLAALGAADWSDPAGWIVPTDAPGGWPR